MLGSLPAACVVSVAARHLVSDLAHDDRGADASSVTSADDSGLACALLAALESSVVRRMVYLGRCAAYLHDSLVKFTDIPGAVR